MGKYSTHAPRPRDYWPTPPEPVLPLLAHLAPGSVFLEPCAGDGALIRTLEACGHICTAALDIEPQGPGIIAADALTAPLPAAPLIITNPPWNRDVLHPMITRFAAHAPSWLLFQANWVFTDQAAAFAPILQAVVPVGRVSWLGNGKPGKEDAAWYLFDAARPVAHARLYAGRGR